MAVKRNQPTLHAALAELPQAQVDRQLRRRRGHGRAETSSIAVLPAASVPGIEDRFPLEAQVLRVIRTRTDRATGKRTREVLYAITSLDHRQAAPPCWSTGCRTIGGSKTAFTTSGM